MTLEDEAGVANIIVWPKAFERLRAIVIGARFVAVTGELQNEAGVIHLIAERIEDLTPMLGLLPTGPRDRALAPADEARRPQPTRRRSGRATASRKCSFSPIRASPRRRPRSLLASLARAWPRRGRNFHQ